MEEASHPGPELRRLRRGSVRNVVPRVGDRDVVVTDDEDDVPSEPRTVTMPSELVPRFGGSPWSTPQVIRNRGSTVLDMTEADTDSEDDCGQDVTVFDPVDTDDELSETLIDALQRDLEHNASRTSVSGGCGRCVVESC